MQCPWAIPLCLACGHATCSFYKNFGQWYSLSLWTSYLKLSFLNKFWSSKVWIKSVVAHSTLKFSDELRLRELHLSYLTFHQPIEPPTFHLPPKFLYRFYFALESGFLLCPFWSLTWCTQTRTLANMKDTKFRHHLRLPDSGISRCNKNSCNSQRHKIIRYPLNGSFPLASFVT